MADGKDITERITKGVRNGALGGFSQPVAMIATFGATYKPNENQLSDINTMKSNLGLNTIHYSFRTGGFYQIINKRAVTWNNTVAMPNRKQLADFHGNEFAHVFQSYRDWGLMQGNGIIEQFLDSFTDIDPYNTPNYQEYEAHKIIWKNNRGY